MYKVIFNGDIKNYEIFNSYEEAKKFASQFLNSKIIKFDK